MNSPGEISILCTGDLHLGRHPSGIATGDHSPTKVWRRIVDAAVERNVDALALTGDIVDRQNRYFEALGPLEQGIRRLRGASIATVAVAGNHDYNVLGELADALDDTAFTLLGAGGTWESMIVDTDSGPMRCVGWSYPDRHVTDSPLATLDIDTTDDLPTIGLLHGEVDRPDSSYAPVTSSELAGSGIQTWLLGHIHRPHTLDIGAAHTALYPGSPQPLDPGETGVHGPWIVDLDADGGAGVTQLALASLRYRNLNVDLDGATDDSFRQTVSTAIRDDLRTIATTFERTERLVYRLEYTGRTALHRRLRDRSEAMIGDLQLHFEGVTADVDAIRRHTTPDLDLEAIAGDGDPPAVLARWLLQIQNGEDTDETRQLRAAIDNRIDDVYRANAYEPLRADEQTARRPDGDWTTNQIIAQGLALLDELLAQSQR